jgi:hypothetical protein
VHGDVDRRVALCQRPHRRRDRSDRPENAAGQGEQSERDEQRCGQQGRGVPQKNRVRLTGQGFGPCHHRVEGGVGEIDDRHLIDGVALSQFHGCDRGRLVQAQRVEDGLRNRCGLAFEVVGMSLLVRGPDRLRNVGNRLGRSQPSALQARALLGGRHGLGQRPSGLRRQRRLDPQRDIADRNAGRPRRPLDGEVALQDPVRPRDRGVNRIGRCGQRIEQILEGLERGREQRRVTLGLGQSQGAVDPGAEGVQGLLGRIQPAQRRGYGGHILLVQE